MLIVGLTGGIATGKSTVSGILREKGFYIIDADKLAHDCMKAGTHVYREVISYFGEGIKGSDDEIDRKKLGKIVFNDYGKLKILNSIVHPEVIRRIKEDIDAKISSGTKCVVIDAALLIEAGFIEMVDKLIVVSSSKDKQIERLVKDKGLTREDAEKRINSQMPLEEKEKMSDFVISNEKGINELKGQVENIIKNLKERGGSYG